MTEEKTLRIQTEEEFMMAAHSCDSKKDLPVLNSSDRFFYDLYSDLLESIYYHFKQFTFLFFLEDFPWRNMLTVEKKFVPKFAALQRGMAHIGKYIEAHLMSTKQKEVSAAVFVLSSLDDKYLDFVLKKFMSVENDYISAYVKGLKRGQNLQLTTKLFSILAICSESIEIACIEIIKYRNDFDPEQFAPYREQFDLDKAPSVLDKSNDNSEHKTLQDLVNEMEADQNSYDTRKKAWQEFVIQSKKQIAFEPDWSVKKQEAAIRMCQQAID